MDHPARFREIMGQFATGVTIVTIGAQGQPYGLTVNSLASVSLDPLLLLICLDRKLAGLNFFQTGRHFAVNILSDDQEPLSRLFAQPGSERPADVYVPGTADVPLIRGTLGALECQVRDIHSGGDHVIVIGEVRHMHLAGDAPARKPLIYFRGNYSGLR